jgi:hypothetical protein
MSTSGSFTVDLEVGARGVRRGRREIASEMEEPVPPRPVDAGRIPRISRLMALAIRMRRLVDEGVVHDYSDLARLGGVSIPRMTQIMRLLLLAPDIQEEILELPRVLAGRDPVRESQMRKIAGSARWAEQRAAWVAHRGHACEPPERPRRELPR